MIHNRFQKSTLGLFAEIVIAKQVSALEAGVAGTAIGATPASAVVPITIGASPTIGDTVTVTIDGIAYTYVVPAGGATTQQAHDGIKGALQANSQGVLVTLDSGTTSSSYTLTWPNGTAGNGKVISLAKVGTTFTVAGNVTFAGGLAGDAVGADTIADFITNEVAGSIWAFWDDTNTALVAGDTVNPINNKRKFYYAWKQGDATNFKRTSAIPVANMKYTSLAANAGTASVKKVAFGGTYSLGQILHVRIIDKTQTELPFPSYEYNVTIGGSGINQATIDIAAKINAETIAKIVTATTATNELTLTADSKYTSFEITTYIETTTAQPTDATAPVRTTTTAQVFPIGDTSSVTIAEQYAKENLGNPIYTGNMFTPDEFGTWVSNVDGTLTYGTLIVTNDRSEQGVVRNYNQRNYCVIFVKTGDEAKLAAL